MSLLSLIISKRGTCRLLHLMLIEQRHHLLLLRQSIHGCSPLDLRILNLRRDDIAVSSGLQLGHASSIALVWQSQVRHDVLGKLVVLQ